jgi:hypothetical protein
MQRLPRAQRGSAMQRRHDAPSARLQAMIMTCRLFWPVQALPDNILGG